MTPRRLSVWCVSPAWRRFAVTRLALAQRAHLAGELAARGIDLHVVIVSDDENLDIARGHGFDTVEMGNDHLGARFNAGYEYAAEQGADYFVHIGSDDWVHPEAFAPLADEPVSIIAGRRMAFVDLLTGRARCALLDGPHGVIPWIIPRRLLEPTGFQPIRPDRDRGMDGYLVRGIRRSPTARVHWIFHDPHPFARVDFKSDTNINLYAGLPAGFGRVLPGHPWSRLTEHYPRELVELARLTHLAYLEDGCRN